MGKQDLSQVTKTPSLQGKQKFIDVTVVTLQALSYDVHERPSTSR
jgi:hypothetical protein